MPKIFGTVILFTFLIAIVAGCGNDENKNSTTRSSSTAQSSPGTRDYSETPDPAEPSERPANGKSDVANHIADIPKKGDSLQVVAEPDSITVLVNKQNVLPSDYKPKDLVYPDIPFIFKEKIEKRMMRREAARALEQLVAEARKDGIFLAGVSAYRSNATQKAVFNNFVKRDGEAKARTYSAFPGSSEHETGLAIDISGADGKCAAVDCFAGTVEAQWLDQHAAEYGLLFQL